MYTSGQFIHYLSLWEDWSNNSFFQENRILEIIMTLYTLTEIFLFGSRISDSYENDDINIKLKLNNQYNRSLNFLNPLRFLDNDYRCRSQSPILIEKKISKIDLDANNSDIALDVLIHIFNIFNWNSKEIRNILKDDQKKFLSMNY
jgi:hypothetical protein